MAAWILAGTLAAVLRAGTVQPFARWTFDGSWADSAGSLDLAPNPDGSAGLIDGWAWLANEAVVGTPPVPIRLGDWTVHAEVRILSPGTGRMTLVEVTSLDGRQRDALEFHSNGATSGSWRWVTAAPAQVTLIPTLVETNTSTTVHLTVVNTAEGGVRIYRDGLPIGSYSSGQPHVYEPGQARVKLGPPVSSWPNWMNVRVGEVALFDRALSPAEVVDLVPALEWRSPTAMEASGAARVQLVRLGPVDEAMRVRVATRDGKARAGVDYVARDFSVEFAAGERVREIEVPLINDDLGAGWRSFDLVFSDSEPSRRLPSPAVVWIQDDDELVRLVGEVDGDHREGGRVTVHLTRTGSVQSARRFQTRVRLVPTPPDALVRPARPGIDLGRTEHTFELGPGITSLTAEFDLPDDREADGLRGFEVQWESEAGEVEPRRWGGPGGPFAFIAVDSWQIAIEDNEHEIFEQEVSLHPYVAQMGGGPVRLSNGGLMVWGAVCQTGGCIQRMWLLRGDGQPSSGFGKGVGWMDLRVAGGSLDELAVAEASADRVLVIGRATTPAGAVRSLLWAIHPDGSPDTTFAGGEFFDLGDGVLEGESGAKLSVLSSHGDGGVWLDTHLGLLKVSRDGRKVQRAVGPEGWEQQSLAPDGTVWFLKEWEGLRRCQIDGAPAPGFPGWVGQGSQSIIGVDGIGRCYVRIGMDGLGPQGDFASSVVRFLPTGALDERYRVLPRSERFRALRVESDGTLFGCESSENPYYVELMRWDPDGAPTSMGDFVASGVPRIHWLTRLERLPEDGFILEGLVPVGGGWSANYTGFLGSDGRVRGFDAYGHWDGSGIWSRKRTFWTRRLPWREAPRVGFARTGLFVSGDTAFLPVRRSGSTAQRVKVRGEWQQRIRGQWVAGVGQTFEVEFPEGVADTVAAVRLPEQVGRPGTREFLMRLVETGAEDGADFGVCRVWALAPGIPLGEGLQMHRVNGPDLAMEAVLTGVTTERGFLESAESPRGPWVPIAEVDAGWNEWNAELSTLDGANNRWAMPVHAGPEPMRFYRQR